MRYVRAPLGTSGRSITSRSGPSINNKLGFSLKITGTDIIDVHVKWEERSQSFYFGVWNEEEEVTVWFFKITLVAETMRDVEILGGTKVCRILRHSPLTDTYSLIIAFAS